MQSSTVQPKQCNLLDLFVNRVLVAVGAKLFQLDPIGRVPTVLGRGIARHTGRSLV